MASNTRQTDSRKTIKKKKKKQKRGMPVGVKILLGFIMVVVAIVAIVGSVLFGAYKGMAIGTPDITKINISPTQYPSVIVDRQGNQLIQLASAGAKRVNVTASEITDNLRWAFVDIEDERFYDHNGVDLRGLLRAVYRNITEDKTEGASTITQQLVKNNVFNTGQLERSMGSTLKRKVQEQIIAVEVEKTLSKEDILTTYLNTINLGGGNYGIVTAAEYYFGKKPEELTLSECAVLAGITKNPYRLNPATHPSDNRERQEQVLRKMYENGHITEAQYKEALADDVYSRISTNTITNDDSVQYSYFIDALISDLLEDFQTDLGYTYQQAYNAVFSGGLTIECTQDPEVQAIVDREINDDANYPGGITYAISWDLSVQHEDGEMEYFNQNHITKYHKEVLGETDYKLNFYSHEEADEAVAEYKKYLLKKGDNITYEELIYTIQPQMSFSIMDYTTGEVLALIGGRGEKEKNMSLNRATDSVRQPGSCFKILAAYAPAMEVGGYTLATAIDDSPFNYGGDIDREVKNWWGDNYRGLSTVREGIRDSMNVLAVKTMYDVGGSTGVKFLKDFGFTTIDEEQDVGVATALGGITYGITNLEINAAYSTIANGGVYNEPMLYTKVTAKDGSVIIDKTATHETRQVLRPTVAWLLTNAMLDVTTAGTGTAAAIPGTPVSGKTGTTTNTIDLWFVGYVPGGLCGAVWTGYDENVEITTEEVYHEVMYANIMGQVLDQKGWAGGEFEMPDGIIQDYVCKKSGDIPADLCQWDGSVLSEYFEADNVPYEYCDTHFAVSVCTYSGLLASSGCPAESMICINRPPDVTGGEPKGITADSARSAPYAYCDGNHNTKKKDNKDTNSETTAENKEETPTTEAAPVDEGGGEAGGGEEG